MSDSTGRSSRRSKATQCKDCGSAEVGWAAERGWKNPGTAGCRCLPCYLEHNRQRYHRRTSGVGKPRVQRDRVLIGPPRPGSRRKDANYVPRITMVDCTKCGEQFRLRNKSTVCPDCTPPRAASAARRREAEAQGDAGIHWTTVGKRDGWRCHLCGGSVKQVAGAAHEPFGANVDHLVPISDGGPHVWSNVALAHRRCNLSRGADGIVQLLLIG